MASISPSWSERSDSLERWIYNFIIFCTITVGGRFISERERDRERQREWARSIQTNPWLPGTEVASSWRTSGDVFRPPDHNSSYFSHNLRSFADSLEVEYVVWSKSGGTTTQQTAIDCIRESEPLEPPLRSKLNKFDQCNGRGFLAKYLAEVCERMLIWYCRYHLNLLRFVIRRWISVSICSRSSLACERNCVASWIFGSDGSSLFRNNSVKVESNCMMVWLNQWL